MFHPSPGKPGGARGSGAVVAHHLAKVRVAGSNPVFRSEKAVADPCIGRLGGVAERRGNGLQSRVHGFKSRLHLALQCGAIGAAGARFLDTEEVTGSIPVSPTNICSGASCLIRQEAFVVGAVAPVVGCGVDVSAGVPEGVNMIVEVVRAVHGAVTGGVTRVLLERPGVAPPQSRDGNRCAGAARLLRRPVPADL